MDTTIIISALIKREAASSKAILELDHDYYSTDVLIREAHTHLPEIWESSQLDPYEFIDVFLGMLRKVKIASLSPATMVIGLVSQALMIAALPLPLHL